MTSDGRTAMNEITAITMNTTKMTSSRVQRTFLRARSFDGARTRVEFGLSWGDRRATRW
jgi:hypothetical protein